MATLATMRKAAVRRTTPTIIPVTVPRAIRATRVITTTIKEVMANMANTTMLPIMAKREDTINHIMKKEATTVSITLLARATKEVNSERKRDTRRDRKPPDTITSLTRMIITRSINSTMITIRADTTPNTAASMDTMAANLATTRREAATRAATMMTTTARRDILTKDTTKTNTRDTKDMEDMKAITPIIPITARRADTPEERNTVSVVASTKNIHQVSLQPSLPSYNSFITNTFVTKKSFQAMAPIASHILYTSWIETELGFCFIAISLMLITSSLPVYFCVTK